MVQRRPWPFAIGALALLLILAAPALGMRLGFPDAGNDPPDTMTRQAYDLNSEGFGPGSNGNIVTSDDPFYGAKVDFLITDDHRLEFTYFSDEQEQETNNIFVDANGDQIGSFTPSTFKFGGSNWIAGRQRCASIP